MDRINLMISTTAKGPKKQQAVGMFLIEQLHNGVPETIQKKLKRESITGKELTLQLLANALCIINRLNKEFESIEIYLEEQSICATFTNQWLKKWSQTGWKTAKGEDVAYAEIYKIIIQEIDKCTGRFIFMNGQSRYSNWMRTELGREMSRLNDIAVAEKSIKIIKENLDHVEHEEE